MKIYVLRHGTTELNKQKNLNGQIDEGLAPEGIEIAKKTKLPKTITHIYSSPMLRTRQTTAIVAQPQTKITFVDAIREVNMGTLAGKSWHLMANGQELKTKHRSIQYDYHDIGGESAADVKARIIAFLKEINNKHQDYEVMLVSHGGIIRVLHLLESKKALIDEVENVSLHVFDIDKIIDD